MRINKPFDAPKKSDYLQAYFCSKNDVNIMFTRMSESDDDQFFDALDESDDIQREWDLMMVSLKVEVKVWSNRFAKRLDLGVYNIPLQFIKGVRAEVEYPEKNLESYEFCFWMSVLVFVGYLFKKN